MVNVGMKIKFKDGQQRTITSVKSFRRYKVIELDSKWICMKNIKVENNRLTIDSFGVLNLK